MTTLGSRCHKKIRLSSNERGGDTLSGPKKSYASLYFGSLIPALLILLLRVFFFFCLGRGLLLRPNEGRLAPILILYPLLCTRFAFSVRYWDHTWGRSPLFLLGSDLLRGPRLFSRRGRVMGPRHLFLNSSTEEPQYLFSTTPFWRRFFSAGFPALHLLHLQQQQEIDCRRSLSTLSPGSLGSYFCHPRTSGKILPRQCADAK